MLGGERFWANLLWRVVRTQWQRKIRVFIGVKNNTAFKSISCVAKIKQKQPKKCLEISQFKSSDFPWNVFTTIWDMWTGFKVFHSRLKREDPLTSQCLMSMTVVTMRLGFLYVLISRRIYLSRCKILTLVAKTLFFCRLNDFRYKSYNPG